MQIYFQIVVSGTSLRLFVEKIYFVENILKHVNEQTDDEGTDQRIWISLNDSSLRVGGSNIQVVIVQCISRVVLGLLEK